MKSRIGIIGAMDEEIIFIKKRMSGITEHKIGIYLFLNGSIDYIPVVLLQSGVGKVNAATETTLMIEHYRPLVIINTGSAGAVEPSMQIGDIIIAQQILHHDVDTTAFGYAKGQIPKMPTTFDPHPDLIEIAAGLGESLNEVNHNTLLRGIYLSRQEKVGTGFVTTFDIRMKEPNREPVIDVPALHTIEHLGATFLRNNTEWKKRIIYFGPMGCRTGFYLLVADDAKSKEIFPLVKELFQFISNYNDLVPGACGNYLSMDLPIARWESNKFLDEVLEQMKLVYLQGIKFSTKRRDIS